MKREDYVLVFTTKQKSTSGSIFCGVCKHGVVVSGTMCPCNHSRCSYENSSHYVKFNNKIHDIIATKEFCRGHSMGCGRLCDTCVLTNTFHVEVI